MSKIEINLYNNTVPAGQQVTIPQRVETNETDIALLKVETDAVQAEADITKAEVIQARGNYASVDSRLDGFDSSLADMRYDVKKYGAVGGGIIDDTTAFIACMTAAPKVAKIIAPNDTYKLTSQIIDSVGHEWDFCGSTINTSSYDAAILFTGTLKTTKTLAAAYNFYNGTVSDNQITLSDVTNIAVGDLANIVSTELFDTSRLYFYKGGNFLVKKIVGNVVYLDGTMPFDMDIATHTVTVKIYSTITPVVKNLVLNGTTTLDDTSGFNLGMDFEYCKNVIVENVKIASFKANIQIKKCVGVSLNAVETGHSANSEDWAYGVSIFSSTNVAVKNLITNSGTTGLVWTGEEPSYNILLENCNLAAETSYEGLGSHANVLGVTLIACMVNGFSFQGNCHAVNCDFMNDEITTTSAYLGLGEKYFQSNYSFDKCRFYNQQITVRDYYQVASATRKYLGSITFNNCVGFELSININVLSSGAKIAMVNRVLIENCNDFAVTFSDLIDTLTIKDSVTSYNTNIIQQIIQGSTYQKVKNILIDNVKMPKQYNCINIQNADFVMVKGFGYTTADYTNAAETYANIGVLHLENYNNIGAQYGVVLGATVARMVMINSEIVFHTAFATQMAQVTRATATELKTGGEYMNLMSATNNAKYKVQIAAGVHTLTAV